MSHDEKQSITMDGYVTRADGYSNKPIVKPRPAPPAPMNLKPASPEPLAAIKTVKK